MNNKDRFVEWYIGQINPKTGRPFKEGPAKTYIAYEAIHKLVFGIS